MGGIFLFFACFMIDYCAQMWHNIDTAKCADYAILQTDIMGTDTF